MRKELTLAALLLLGLPCAAQTPASHDGVVVNDVHSKLNETRVERIVSPTSVREVQAAIRQAKTEGKAVSIAGGRHAMGGQQFGAGTILIDTSRLNRVLNLDTAVGTLDVQAGIRWPELLDYLDRAQQGQAVQWGIRQKQTGADRLSIGGALSANAHGRGLRFKKLLPRDLLDVGDVSLGDA